MRNNSNSKHEGKEIGISKNGIKIIDCINCRFFHQIPIPDTLERVEYYEQRYFQETNPIILKSRKKI